MLKKKKEREQAKSNFGNDKFRQRQIQAKPNTGQEKKRSIGIRPPSSGDDIVDLV